MLTSKLYKLTILGNNKDKSQVIEKLQTTGVLHIEDSDLIIEKLNKDKSFEKTDEISLLLLKLNFILEQTNIEKKFELKKLPNINYVLNDTYKLLENHYEKIKNLSEKKEQILAQIKELENQLDQIKKLPFKLKNTNSNKFQTTIYKSEKILPLKIPFKHILKIIKKDQIYYKLTYLRQDKKKLEEHLRNTPIKKLNLPEFEDSEEYKKQIISNLKHLKQELSKTFKNIEININGQQSKILFSYICLENYYAQYTISNKFQTTKNHFIIKGYAEPSNIEKIRSISNITIYIEHADEKSPTKLEKKPILENFQQITKLFSIPKYGAADPTLMISLFYPIFFGLMLSDIGYGLMLLALVIGIHFKFKEKAKDITVIFGLSAIFSIIAGMLFGSFFGELIKITPIIGDSFSISFKLLIASLIIGLIHINTALVLKIIQNKNMKKDFVEYLAVVPFILIQIIMATLYFKFNILSTILIILLIATLLKTKGMFGIMDITGFFGTWFSYARLLALNLATAGVALAINIIANKTLSFGSFGIVFWFMILIIGHLFNFVINIIGVTINSARLHYVEFFSQFFEGGGVEFEPFKIKQKLEE